MHMFDLTGLRFGKWQAISYIHHANKIYWLCRCTCGNLKYVRGSALTSNKSLSCKKCANTRHGLTGNALLYIWKNMKQRCYNPKNKSYKYYGARGIKIHKDWLNNPKAFVDWAIINGYNKGLEIDRINNNGDYEPNNCRFVTHLINMNNTRKSKIYN